MPYRTVTANKGSLRYLIVTGTMYAHMCRLTTSTKNE